MEALHLGSYHLLSSSSFRSFNYITNSSHTLKRFRPLTFRRTQVRAVGTVPQSQSEATDPEEPPIVDLAFVNVSCKLGNVKFEGFVLAYRVWFCVCVCVCVFFQSVLLPDGTPDVHLRRACGGQKLRNIMLDSNIDLYGPYVSFPVH